MSLKYNNKKLLKEALSLSTDLTLINRFNIKMKKPQT